MSRVINRVQKGGHRVSEDKIYERYFRSLENLHLALPLCFRAYFFDNSGKEQQLIAELYQGRLELKTDDLPNWFLDFVLPYYVY
jgi:predicted ABC-type ATPase